MFTRTLKYFVLLLIAMSFAGSASMSAYFTQHGSFKPNTEITRAYEAYQVNPDLNYYVSGAATHPNAIIGLSKKYTLETSLWKKVNMTPEKLQDLITDMKEKAEVSNLYLLGSSMLDEQGREIGTWYSALFADSYIDVKGEKVTVYRPSQKTFHKGDK